MNECRRMDTLSVSQRETSPVRLVNRGNAMRIRKHILPHRLLDILGFLLIAVFLPIVFMFEIIVVVPTFHEEGGLCHTLTLLIASFLIFNIKSNMLACMMIDTSYDHSVDPQASGEAAIQDGWRWCEVCQRLAPPRSYHCAICRSCILKSDHHCFYTGCCIGHRNHRYFMMFIFHLAIGSTYALVYSSLYLWVVHANIYRNWFTLLKIFCPMLMLVYGSMWNNLYLIFYGLNWLAVFYSVVLSIYHGTTVCRGGVATERKKGYPYSVGWRKNLRDVFGDRMHLVWLSPFVKSPLPRDGINWKPQKLHEQ